MIFNQENISVEVSSKAIDLGNKSLISSSMRKETQHGGKDSDSDSIVLYHMTTLEIIPLIFKFGFFGIIYMPTLIKGETYDNGPTLVFKVPKNHVASRDGVFYCLRDQYDPSDNFKIALQLLKKEFHNKNDYTMRDKIESLIVACSKNDLGHISNTMIDIGATKDINRQLKEEGKISSDTYNKIIQVIESSQVKKQDNIVSSNVEEKQNFYSIENPGGIDFRTLPIVTQAITNLNTNISSSAINRLSGINLDTEWQGIERMDSSGIRISPERIKEYVQAACVKGSIIQIRDKILGSFVNNVE